MNTPPVFREKKNLFFKSFIQKKLVEEDGHKKVNKERPSCK